MTISDFIQLLIGHAGSEDSALKQSIAKLVLIHKDTARSSDQIFKEVKRLATSEGVPGVATYFRNPSSTMIAAVGNAIFYNMHSVTIAPNRPNNGGKSPKFIAGKVLEALASVLKDELVKVPENEV